MRINLKKMLPYGILAFISIVVLFSMTKEPFVTTVNTQPMVQTSLAAGINSKSAVGRTANNYNASSARVNNASSPVMGLVMAGLGITVVLLGLYFGMAFM